MESQITAVLIQNLDRLDENVKEESEGVHNTLGMWEEGGCEGVHNTLGMWEGG